MNRFDPMKAAARQGAASALERYDYATLQSQHAAPRLVKSWGIAAAEAGELVAAERRRRADRR